MARVEFHGWDTTYAPAWAVDYTGDRVASLPGGAQLDPTQFGYLGDWAVQLNGAASAGATSLTVDPLPADLGRGTVLDFTGTGEFARVTANAVKGATSVSVEAIDAGIEDNDVAYYGNVRKRVDHGTVVGRTNAERDAGTGFGPAVSTDDEIYILIHTVYDANINAECELYRKGRGVKYNHLPNWANLGGPLQTALASRYELVRGAV